MAYAVISHWTNDEAQREGSYAAAREKFAPALKALGATDAFFIATTTTTFQVVTVYPDEATAKAALAKQAAIRAQAAQQLPVKLVAELQGPVFASA